MNKSQENFTDQDIRTRYAQINDSGIVPTDDMYPDILNRPLYQAVSPGGQHGHVEGPHGPDGIRDITVDSFLQRISNSYLDIINDLLSGNITVDTFSRDYRPIAMAILLIIISVFFVFFNKGF